MRWAWLLALYGCRIGFDATDRSDATRGDDGSGDSTTIDGPAVVGCPVFAMFCDDFELGNLSRWTKTDVTVAAGYVKASGARVRNGSFALEAFSPAGTTEVVDAVLQFSAQTTGTLAVRSWFNATIRLDGYDLVTALSNKQTPQYATAGGNSSSLWVSTEADVNDMGFDHPSSTPTPNTDVWTCLELVYDFASPGPARIRVFVDDTMVLDVPPSDPTAAFDEVQIGIPRADASGQHIYVDDVVIAAQRIGC